MLSSALLNIAAYAAYDGLKKGAEIVIKEVGELKEAYDQKEIKEMAEAVSKLKSEETAAKPLTVSRPAGSNVFDQFNRPRSTNLLEIYSAKSPEKPVSKAGSTNLLKKFAAERGGEIVVCDAVFKGPPAATEARAPRDVRKSV